MLSGDPRFSSVPGDGFITSIGVRSGPNPAPLRFSIFRQLSTPGFGAESQCCFFVRETTEVRPVPNASTVFPVILPVERNTRRGFLAVDLVGISARANTGTLPLAVVGPVNSFNLTTPGSVNAGFFYPRLGAVPNDVGGGRREEAIPGIEVLLRFTWTNVLTPQLRSRTVSVRNNRAPVSLLCNSNRTCQGVIEILSRAPAGAIAPLNSAQRRYGRISYRIPKRKRAAIQVPLSSQGRLAMRRAKTVRATLRLIPRGAVRREESLTLRRR